VPASRRGSSALSTLGVAYQPLVRWPERRVYGYEALLRSAEPTLPTPAAVLDAAERLGRVHGLGRIIRARVVADIRRAPAGAAVFVNLHPHGLEDAGLYDPSEPLSEHARQIVLEVTERASPKPAMLRPSV
jgi:EAL domain-containing protein (putative c-di-GMP-specific phosphodiesterase class I)